ncbi:hypothetical protein KIH86_17480 [Paenibacillus sp. HN-1]|uniref:hypothetical protein n=1 Tax=Paenibacillus TaxID=44249 RepID=UPI001CA9662B|nr:MULTISPECIES: hypothetical protein [Paenibacillus]MBY9081840.1 hypothetical protein [Paenibacillus sp. CGMCC 1.18879]MBY9086002.1 hypothetical protein [Paenibacillus sinensis]
MSMSMYPGTQNLIYQADSASVHHVRKVRDQMHGSLKHYMNRKVRVQTIDGEVYEGCIAGLDAGHLYLTVMYEATTTTTTTTMPAPPARAFFPSPFHPTHFPVNPAGSALLPLVLFNLLAISLI